MPSPNKTQPQVVERRDKMTKENTSDLINSIKLQDALTAVKIAMNFNEVQDKTTTLIVKNLSSVDQNLKLLATKVMELEKKIESLESYANREI